MNGLNNQTYLLLLIISNIVAVLQFIAAIKWPRIARLSFFVLFVWAGWTNWTTSRETPQFYLEYADFALFQWYTDLINGWFADYIQTAVGLIAICQFLIAISMILKGWIYKTGSIGAMIFLIAILPLGVGSGFPCTGIMAVAIFILIKKHNIGFIWKKNKIVSVL